MVYGKHKCFRDMKQRRLNFMYGGLDVSISSKLIKCFKMFDDGKQRH